MLQQQAVPRPVALVNGHTFMDDLAPLSLTTFINLFELYSSMRTFAHSPLALTLHIANLRVDKDTCLSTCLCCLEEDGGTSDHSTSTICIHHIAVSAQAEERTYYNSLAQSFCVLQLQLAECIADPQCFENLACLQLCNGRKDESGCQVLHGDRTSQ